MIALAIAATITVTSCFDDIEQAPIPGTTTSAGVWDQSLWDQANHQ